MVDNVSGLRYNTGKPPVSLVAFAGIEGAARATESGIAKYKLNNWRGGLYLSEILDSLLRHSYKLASPEEPDIDPESNLHHSDHIAWNALVLSHGIKYGWPWHPLSKTNNLPKNNKKKIKKKNKK